jgi:ribosomal protein S18 acetylase RimI-like enzyme
MDDPSTLLQHQLTQQAAARVWLRSASPEDAPFLAQLQRRVQAEAIERLGGDPTPFVSGPLAELQFRAQSAAYRAAYPLGCDYIVLRRESDRPIGRLLIDWSRQARPAVVLAHIAVLPEARAGAVGLQLLRAFVATCDGTRQAAELSVAPNNPARAIYRRLGFIEADAESFPISMRREPRSAARL